MSDTAIELNDVRVTIGGTPVLEGITLSVREGEIMSIVGPNGSGKSTLLRTVMGLLKPERGTVRVRGRAPGTLPRGTIGYLPQKSSVDFAMPVSVHDVVAMARYAGKGFVERLDTTDRSRIDESLESLEIAPLRDRHFGSLSGGQKQRALIARALALEPRILLLDEPSTGLDAVAQDSFYQILLRLRDEKKLTIVMVSHDIGAISSVVDSLACLKTRLHFHGTPTDCFRSGSLDSVFGKNIHYVKHDRRCDTCGEE